MRRDGNSFNLTLSVSTQVRSSKQETALDLSTLARQKKVKSRADTFSVSQRAKRRFEFPPSKRSREVARGLVKQVKEDCAKLLPQSIVPARIKSAESEAPEDVEDSANEVSPEGQGEAGLQGPNLASAVTAGTSSLVAVLGLADAASGRMQQAFN